jgi:hypothetical protein
MGLHCRRDTIVELDMRGNREVLVVRDVAIERGWMKSI